ncbi:armadillo-type protein [Gongronella butleri]|nr:armadillo-type protein [Gongronella butleri]
MLDADLDLPTSTLLDERQEWNDIFLNDDQSIVIPFPQDDSVLDIPLQPPLAGFGMSFTAPVSRVNTMVPLNDATPLEILCEYASGTSPSFRLMAARQLKPVLDHCTVEEAIEIVLPLFLELALDPDAGVRECIVKDSCAIIQYFYAHAPPLTPDTADAPPRPAIPPAIFSFPWIEWLSDDNNSTMPAFCQQTVMTIAADLAARPALLDQEMVHGLLHDLFALAKGDKQRDATTRKIIDTRPDAVDAGDAHLAKAACLSMIPMLCPYFGSDRCMQYCVPIIETFYSDPAFYVRKEAAQALGSVLAHVNPDVLRLQLIPLYEQLSNDTTWHVRNTNLLALPTLCDLVPHDEKTRLVTDIVSRLKNDKSPQVQFTLAELSGALIAKFLPADWENTMEPGEVPETLLDFFLSLSAYSRPSADRHLPEDEYVLLCSFNFPAALVTAGAAVWETRFKEIYMRLAKDHQVRVRSSLAHSLHEIARIIGPMRAERDLIHIFALYLMDMNQVKEGVLRHLADFMHCLPASSRDEYLPVLKEIWEGITHHYQFREIVIDQLSRLVAFCTLDQAVEHLLPLLVMAVQDDVAIVRKNGSQVIAQLVQTFQHHHDRFDILVSTLMGRLHPLTASLKYHHRLIYITICHHMIASTTISMDACVKWILPHLMSLEKDPVVNVRIALSSCISLLLDKSYWEEPMTAVLKRLQEDPDEDVRFHVNGKNAPSAPPTPTKTAQATLSQLPSPPYSLEEKIAA